MHLDSARQINSMPMMPRNSVEHDRQSENPDDSEDNQAAIQDALDVFDLLCLGPVIIGKKQAGASSPSAIAASAVHNFLSII